MNKFFQAIAAITIILAMSTTVKAGHIFGADLYYTHISGNTYRITMTIYGDCSGAIFNTLSTSAPQIAIYNSASLLQTINLGVASAGIEVTPVCPSQINNTTCNGGAIPGVKQFIYTGNITLPVTSANWRFRFNGNLGGGSQAGRSASITNLVFNAGNIMVLEASLNNTLAPNSAPVYTTIPTPFFCINAPAQYNPGAVDPDNDNLSFSLTQGLTPAGTVTYQPGYSSAAPLTVSPGSLTMSALTGQLNFIPNLVQTSLVVNRVEEYRNGVLVGTSMREMTFVVMNNCNNNPPTGTIGSTPNNTVFNVCRSQGPFSFNVNASDPDGNNISVTTAGVPAGAVLNVTGNGTVSPAISFSWTTTNTPAGTYIFYVTFTDDGCPLSSKQTVAYTVNIVPDPSVTYTLLQPATCIKKAVFSVTPSGPSAPFSMTVLQGAATVHIFTGLSGAQTDSLLPGTYTIRVTNAAGCIKDTTITLSAPPVVGVAVIGLTQPTCNNANGAVTIAGSAGAVPYQYAIGTGVYSTNPVFSGLAAGSYILHVRDANNCTKDTAISLQASTGIIPAVAIRRPTCATLTNGEVTLTATNGLAPYTYALGSGLYSSVNTFSSLAAGTYTFHVKDANTCIKDTTITITDSLHVTGNIVITPPLCNGMTNGSLTVTGSGGSIPYTYALGPSAYTASNSFSDLGGGSYSVHIRDGNGCIRDTTAVIDQPLAIQPAVTVTAPACYGDNNGSAAITASGGTPPYTYSIGAGPFASAGTFTGLSAGACTLHIKDHNGCLKDTLIHIQQPQPVTVNYAISDVKCYGESTGAVTVFASGGTPPYTYAANAAAFQTGSTLTGLNAGMHIITAKDSHGCVDTAHIVISQPPPLKIDSFTVTSPTCEGYADGSLSISVSGGKVPYLYSMDNVSFTAAGTFSNLAAGSYTFHVRDNNGCLQQDTITLKGYPAIIIDSVLVDTVSCYGFKDGRIQLFASGGVSPLTYTSDQAAPAGNEFTGLRPATYDIVITDSKNCRKDTSVVVPVPEELVVTIEATNNDCEGLDKNGRLLAMVGGGTAPYHYAWSIAGAPDANAVTDLPNGNYKLTVTDAHRCEASALAEIAYDCCNVFIPTGFTPNNDGRNDLFRVSYKGVLKMIQLIVYNRYGQAVFSTYNLNEGWNGTFNGIQQELGTYYYYLRVMCGEVNPKEKVFKGDVMLIR